MKVKLTCGRVGPKGVQRAGEVFDLPPAEAQAVIAAGQAELFEEQQETTMVSPPENAMLPPAKPRQPHAGKNRSNHFRKE